MSSFMSSINSVLLALPAILIALTFHEYAHGRMAYALGDPTAKLSGRLTLNPWYHIDPVGFLMLLIVHFGWAKPVPVNPDNFRSEVGWKRGMLLVSVAGPLMNLCLAVAGAFLYKLMLAFTPNEWLDLLLQMVRYLIYINLALAVFNMLPIPPLDGSKVLASLLPDSGLNVLYALEKYGSVIFMVLILLMMTGNFNFFSSIVGWMYNFLIVNIVW